METITDLPFLFLDLLKPHRFVGQDLRDIDELATPLDLTVVSDLADKARGAILDRRHFAGVKPWRGTINTGWSFSSQRLMGTLTVVVLLEPIKVVLLVVVGWLGRNLVLQRSMHPFMA